MKSVLGYKKITRQHYFRAHLRHHSRSREEYVLIAFSVARHSLRQT
jgi:hypothetical protein